MNTRLSRSFAAIALGSAIAFAPFAQAAAPSDTPSGDAYRLARTAVAAGDTKGQPFAVVDKKQARLHVFAADGRLRASSPILLGLARGDRSVPGIGEREMSKIRPHERTTPAGRFVSEPGRNLGGEDIVWVDYDAAISMHRVRANQPAERRMQRLASATPADNRISYGCINVPAAFYDAHIKPVLGSAHGVVYVLPEASPMREHFAFLASQDAR